MTEQQMPARIWITAEDQAASWPGSFKRYHASNLDHGDEYPQFVRSDIAERMAEALADLVKAINCRDACSVSESSAFRLAEASARLQSEIESARSALSAFRSATQDTEARHD